MYTRCILTALCVGVRALRLGRCLLTMVYRTHAYVYHGRDHGRDRDRDRTSVLCVANELGLDSLGVDINQRCVQYTH